MEPGVYILAEGKNDRFEGADPEGLADAHPSWSIDVKRLSPWSAVTIPDNCRDKGGIKAWRSCIKKLDSACLICSRCSSTMDGLRDLMDIIRLSPWDCLIAAEQGQGRGQKQRSWFSPPGNLYVSWYWPDPETIENAAPGWLGLASLMAGEITASVLESFGLQVQIKWPNDLLINDRKACGILVEHKKESLVVGIGMNLDPAPEKYRLKDSYSMPAGSLIGTGLEVTPLEMWFRLADTGRSRFYNYIKRMNPGAFVELVDRRLAWKNSKVMVKKTKDDAFSARIVGLSADGGLVVRRNGEPFVLYTGSILRNADCVQ